MIQKWEYRTMVRAHRTMNKDRDLNTAAVPSPQIGGWPTGWNVNIAALLPAIGDEGWEFVAISSMTSTFSIDGQPGVVTEEVWVFKRPKP